MKTPVVDFIQNYRDSRVVRLHMPGHKGRARLGFEEFDITEVHGADALYEAEGILFESEQNATVLFGSGRTVYSAEGSSQCIKAMLHLAMLHAPSGAKPVILAARNVHKAFIHAAALLDFTPYWLYPETSDSLCSCAVSAETVDAELTKIGEPVTGVYVTSPDYLGGIADIKGLAEVCHRHGTRLIVDNAHGAYTHFLNASLHPLDLGADFVCDSAHKTLPVLTGGAYLHVSKNLGEEVRADMKNAMALFGSTSPSYLIMASLDLCNQYLAEGYRETLDVFCRRLKEVKGELSANGWEVEMTDPLRITLRAPAGHTGEELADRLRASGVECEYADDDYLVLMLTPENDEKDLEKLLAGLGKNEEPYLPGRRILLAKEESVMSIRSAMFAPHEMIPVSEAEGRICAAPTVSCPPAIPIVVSGERITKEAVRLFERYHIDQVDVVK